MALGSILVARGILSPEQLTLAEAERRATGERIEHTIARLGLAPSHRVLEVLADELSLPFVRLNDWNPDPETIQALPSRLVFKLRAVPYRVGNGRLELATSDPLRLDSFDEVRTATGLQVDLVLADERDIADFIRTHYGVAGDVLEALGAHATADGHSASSASDAESDRNNGDASEASVVRLVNDLLAEAVRERATDIHIEPYEKALDVRYRIDGVLVDAGVPATIHQFRNAITSRLKIMANMNIAERRRAQDGRISLRIKGQEYDLRVSVIPMLHGEGVVLRVLSKKAVLVGLDELGMPPELLSRWDTLVQRPHGILLVTGPTGSGKSTTLYASLRRIVKGDTKAITVEDPVEYNVPGVNQIQVNHSVGLDFAAGLRAILRHDPDIIMIGEIRDRETAEAAVQASLTGHLVFSTLHTNDAAGAATRLLDMGIEPFLITSTLEGIIAQRLLRRTCRACMIVREPLHGECPPDWINGSNGVAPLAFVAEAVGCRECRGTGYSGRIGAYELMMMTDAARDEIMRRSSASSLAKVAQSEGALLSLRAAALELVRSQITTPSEALASIRL
jgi:type II secretory ATPase GspE/PulE/Tfp pilus assembly ATPase PilB-like protein